MIVNGTSMISGLASWVISGGDWIETIKNQALAAFQSQRRSDTLNAPF